MYFRFYGCRHICSYAKVARRRRPAEAQRTRSLGLGCKLCVVIPVAGQRTHGTTYRALKVTSQVATTGVACAVHGCSVKKEVGGRLKQDSDSDLQLHRILILLY